MGKERDNDPGRGAGITYDTPGEIWFMCVRMHQLLEIHEVPGYFHSLNKLLGICIHVPNPHTIDAARRHWGSILNILRLEHGVEKTALVWDLAGREFIEGSDG